MNRKSASILLLGSEKDSELAEALFELGFELVARVSMFGALERIRHAEFAAIVIDRQSIDFDMLEFTLNARDIDEETPIIVAGQSDDPEDDKRLALLDNVHFIGHIEDTDRLGEEMDKVLTRG